MQVILSVLAGSLLLVSVIASGEDETDRLNQWLDEQYESELLDSPITLTHNGRRERYDEVDDFSLAAEKKSVAKLVSSTELMESRFDYEKLSSQGRVSYDFWKFRAQSQQAELPYLEHAYVFTQFNNSHTYAVAFLANYHTVDTEVDMQAYIRRIQGFARMGEQGLDRAKSAAAKGIRPPRFSYEAVIEQSAQVISGYPFDDGPDESAFWKDASGKIAALGDKGEISAEREQQLREEVRLALLEHTLPFYQRLIAWHKEDIRNTDEKARGVHALPDGQAYYQRQLRDYTHSDMTADEIHELGLREVARIKGEMEGIREEVGFDGSLEAFFAYVRDDPRFYFPDNDEGRSAYLEEVRQLLDQMSSRLPDYFGLLPKSKLEVKRVEPYRERDGGAQFYQVGTADGTRPGVYYVHLSDMGAYNRIDLETTAYHEGSPGHHMQLSIAKELTDIPVFRTNVGYSAYWEGWALYAELLAREMGTFEDPYNDFGRLVAEIWRAIRLVVDTGLHARGWSEEQAVQYMLQNSAIPEVSVRAEIQRYLVMPGQATSYKTGMLKMLELRQKARQRLGGKFDIRQFHDVVLGGGSVPLPILERAVDDWVTSQL